MIITGDAFRKVLVLAPHTDDGEVGCGGLIAKLSELKSEIHYLAFSPCIESVPEGWPKDILSKELFEGTAALGIPSRNVTLLDYKVRMFPSTRQDILEKLITVRGEIMPDLVLTPASYDIHQDHQVIYSESIRAFKHTTILGYEMPWNNYGSHPTLLLKLSEKQFQSKINAIEQYQSQAHRSHMKDGVIHLAKLRGCQIGAELAEAYEVIRWTLE